MADTEWHIVQQVVRNVVVAMKTVIENVQMRLRDGNVISVVFRRDSTDCSKLSYISTSLLEWTTIDHCVCVCVCVCVDVVYRFTDLSPLETDQSEGGEEAGEGGEDDDTLDLTLEGDTGAMCETSEGVSGDGGEGRDTGAVCETSEGGEGRDTGAMCETSEGGEGRDTGAMCETSEGGEGRDTGAMCETSEGVSGDGGEGRDTGAVCETSEGGEGRDTGAVCETSEGVTGDGGEGRGYKRRLSEREATPEVKRPALEGTADQPFPSENKVSLSE